MATVTKDDRPAVGTWLRAMPAVDRLLSSEEVKPLLKVYSRSAVVREIRDGLAQLRAAAISGTLREADLTAEAISNRVLSALHRQTAPFYQRVINATGIVLHTGLGRSPLSREALDAILSTGRHPMRLEFDLDQGTRGMRDEGCARLLRELTGCEAATVVNNNAAATMLILAALSEKRRVLISRGELVEMGGSFRVPEIMEQSGNTLVEVGTTNRTHLSDYERAIDDETGMVLKVHTSNFRIDGFTCDVAIAELVALARRYQVPVVHDLGSGSLLDLSKELGSDEPVVGQSVRAGADAICFSGDKLLGGPQAGIIIGTSAAIDRCRRHPLYRAVRPCRLTYVALEATLRVYLRGPEHALEHIPTLRRLLERGPVLRRRAVSILRRMRSHSQLDCRLVSCESQAGSGSLPAHDLQSWGVRVSSPVWPARTRAAELRRGEPSIVARVRDDAVVLDMRTIDNDECTPIANRLIELCGTVSI
jgi:L-seryl-tRNA(Ser) seleniumtransferase